MTRRRRERGQALTEFALVLPILLIVVVGLFDLGWGIFAWSTVNNAAREGARLAVVDQVATEVKVEVARAASAIGANEANPDDATDPVDIFAPDYRHPATPDTAGSCSPVQQACLAVVRVEYDYSPITPLIGNLIGTITFVGESTFPIEFVCTDAVTCPLGD